ncbi:MAG TPA: hypothetical protein VHO50_03735, partial [Bacteroidales bacterium]|nr:hypothetical protein [Bacteroidales bacterium]
VTGILIYRNIYASNVERNPLFSGGSEGLVINNYIYNPGYAAIHFIYSKSEWKGRDLVPGKMGIEGNYIECGPDSRANISAGAFHGPVEVYWKDNRIRGGPHVKEITGEYTKLFKRPFFPEGLLIMPSYQVKENVLANAGAFPWDRDETDNRIIENARRGTSRVINSEKEAGGYPVIEPVIRKFNNEEWDLERMILKSNQSQKPN